ncbi:PREDICTED: disease resistance protein TAO1-like [Ipomoea nil]|uniref:disease resistance protein TAO1-like n=1 Tax=Ipomoea nil TaxID=35883 RepID=UPI0009014CE4|nr:PREDICTED: disease resistance protein TAO1-like [Ipomoea nil]
MAVVDGDEWSLASEATPSYRYQWDVFLSFRGEDTRHGFTDRLYNELVRNGVRTFRDDEELPRGEEIAPGLIAAIQDSAASIAVISENYASSKWCLEELATILECKRLMLPVFYEVDPSDVRRQGGAFERDFRNHQMTVDAGRILRWREAMTKAGNKSGWDSSVWDEPTLIQSLVKKVLSKLNNTPLGVAKYQVGLHSRVDELLRKLDVKGNGVRMLGLYGMGGIGKTTLAKALFNKLVFHFKKRSFVSNVREISRQSDGLATLQSKLIGDLKSKVIGDLNPDSLPTIPDIAVGIRKIKQCIESAPVVVFLDDVDNLKQLQVLAGGKDWFYEGSRIIITTRDMQVLVGNVDEIVEVKELSFQESLQLFSYHAFGREEPSKSFKDISEKIVSLTTGLPLGLEVFGSFLFYKKRLRDWEDALQKLEQIRPGEVQDVLEISFNALDEQEKRIFLDLSCLFVDKKFMREDAIDIFNGCGFSAETAITDLTAKSLVKIIDGNVLWMHDQLRDMGRQIVHHENYRDPSEHSRLWDYHEIMNILKNLKGTKMIEGITIDFEKKDDLASQKVQQINLQKRYRSPSAIAHLKQSYNKHFGHAAGEEDGILNTRAFKAMANLRLLRINYAELLGNFKFFPAEMKWLQWKGCPLQCIPSEFWPRDIAVLDLSDSNITHVWNKKRLDSFRYKMGEKLHVLNLSNCYFLEELPDLTGIPLEKLNLENCKKLVKIHPSIGNLSTLIYLNLKGCENLMLFPNDVSGLKHLEKLILSDCSSLSELPEDLSGLKSLKELLVNRTLIGTLPKSVYRLKILEIFNLDNCSRLRVLPESIGSLNSLRQLSLNRSALREMPESVGMLTNLETLSLRYCGSLSSIPNTVGDLKSLLELYLDGTSINGLPESVGSLNHLKHLRVSCCKNLTELPNSIGRLSSLIWLCMDETSICEVPDELGSLKNLEKLEMRNCTSIKSLPDSIGNLLSLTSLALDSTSIEELPESIGFLERLWALKLNNCSNLQRLPSSIGNLKNLCYFYMVNTAVTELPDEIGMLSSLKVLKMQKNNQPSQANDTREITLPESFSNLSSLEHLDASAWKISGKISDHFEKMSSLNTLKLGRNNFWSLPSSTKGLTVLKKLLLPDCKELKSLPPLPSSLTDLNVANCSSLEHISDLSNLGSLRELRFSNCKKITDIPGLESLKSLRWLYTVGCNACLPSLKRRISKDTLRHMRYLCVPGSEIPEWLVQELPSFSPRKNRDLKGVLIGVVVSLNQEVEDSFRDKVPAIMDIQAKIIRQGQAILTTTLNLSGVPDTNDDQLYLCRFHETNNLVFMLQEGDKLQVAMREPSCFRGLELKKYGMCLVYEYEDDLDERDEVLFDESHQSVSKKLANFLNAL